MKISVRTESKLQTIADNLMLPVMYILQWNTFEAPQRTHFWNNTKLPIESMSGLDSQAMVSVEADTTARRRWLGYIPLFHMPIFGGWKKYAVIAPRVPQDTWFVGWLAGDTAGVSHIQLDGPVRLLLGSGPAHFFGSNEHGEQIALQMIGQGSVGVRSEFSRLPLL